MNHQPFPATTTSVAAIITAAAASGSGVQSIGTAGLPTSGSTSSSSSLISDSIQRIRLSDDHSAMASASAELMRKRELEVAEFLAQCRNNQHFATSTDSQASPAVAAFDSLRLISAVQQQQQTSATTSPAVSQSAAVLAQQFRVI